MFNRIVLRGLLVVASMVAVGAAAKAETLNLTTGWNIPWNIITNPTSSATQNIGIYDTVSTSVASFAAYDLEIGFTRVSGNGQITVGTGANPTNPAANFSSFSGLAPDTAINLGGGPSVFMDNIDSGPNNNVIPTKLAGGANLISLTFAPVAGNPPTTNSVFDVWAIGAGNTDDNGDSYWSDNIPGDQFNFGNTSPDLVQTFSTTRDGDQVSVLLGQVTVNGVVPEPSTLVLLGAALTCLVACRLRRRFRAA